jgi:hypothetical protein
VPTALDNGQRSPRKLLAAASQEAMLRVLLGLARASPARKIALPMESTLPTLWVISLNGMARSTL